MRVSQLRVWIVAVAATLLTLSAPPAASATEDDESGIQGKAPVLREVAYKRLARARELAERKKCAEALPHLERLRVDRRANDYEAAMAWSVSAYCLQELGQTSDAQAAYREVLARPQIPDSLRITTLYSLAQTYMAADDWARAAEVLESWFAAQTEPSAAAYTLLGQAYFQLKDYARARGPMEKAIEIGRSRGERVKENNYLLLRAIYYGEKDYERLAGVLENLVLDYPRKEYWLQLAAVQAELGRPLRQVAVMQQAYDLGLLTSAADYQLLAQLLLSNEVPVRAAQVLQSGLDRKILDPDARTFRMLADAWVVAKEHTKAIAALEQASNISQDPEMHLRLAQLYMENAQYQQAATSAEAALARGELKRPDIAHIVTGLSYYELRRLDEARSAFAKAAEDERSRGLAQQWEQHIDREAARTAALQAPGKV